MNQLQMIDEELYFTINTSKYIDKYISSVSWQCRKCNKLQMNFFKDGDKRGKKMSCIYCTLFLDSISLLYSKTSILSILCIELECKISRT